MRIGMRMFISFAVHTFLLLSLFHTHIADTMAFFYRGLVYIVCIGLLQALVLVVLRKRLLISAAGILSLSCVFISIHIVFFTLVPVTLDRSVSVYMLERMNTNGTVYTKKQLDEMLINDFVLKGDAVGKRIMEQEQTGSIQPDAGGWRITPRGEWIVDMYRIVGALFDIQPSGR